MKEPNYLITKKNKIVKARINLPSSKSISNRILIINALSFNPYPVNNLSNSDDTKVLQAALFSNETVFDIGHAGTAMRFLTAFLSKIAGEWTVTGSERMKQRPIKILVDALNKLGAHIEYLEKDGFPPLKIFGSHLKGKVIELDGSVSSQYISALLMIAPTIENGLILKLKGEVTSRSYIELTLKLMQHFGIEYEWKANTITVPEQKYLPLEYTVEADWSGASYWYEIAAMTDECEIYLENLKLESLQGDAVIANWFRYFGVESNQHSQGVLLTKTDKELTEKLILDFIENPDMAQTFACLCVALKVPFHFSGLKTLKIKETDRIAALQTELSKLGAVLTEPSHGELFWNGLIEKRKKEDAPFIQTYHDHRMALAFAPMSLNGLKLKINDPEVVSKSYPAFWEDLQTAGFIIDKTE